MTTNADRDVLVSTEMLNAMATMFLAGGDAKDPLAAPIYADYSGLAPLYIQVGGDETLLDDTTRVVAKAEESGVDVRSEVFPDMQHVIQFGVGRMPKPTMRSPRSGIISVRASVSEISARPRTGAGLRNGKSASGGFAGHGEVPTPYPGVSSPRFAEFEVGLIRMRTRGGWSMPRHRAS